MNIEDNLDVSSSNFWNDCYDKNDTGWDLGGTTPIFVDWCNNLNTKRKWSLKSNVICEKP